MKATKLPTMRDDGEFLETKEGSMIEVGSSKFFSWLDNPDNRSFRFIAGNACDQSFTARKETSKTGLADYWYGYRKVDGKLHKRYIGKSEDVTLERLKEVVFALNTPPEPRKKAPSDPEVTQSVSVTNAEEVARLQAEIHRLHTELGNAQATLEAVLGETVA